MNKIFWCFSSLFFILNCSCVHREFVIPPDQQRFDQINRLFLVGNYSEAQRQFGEFIETNPGSPWCDDAQYRIAYSYISIDNNSRDYEKAAEEFLKGIEKYPNSQYDRESQNWLKAIDSIKKCRQILNEKSNEQKMLENSITQLKKERQSLQLETQQLKAEKEQIEKALENLKNILQRFKKSK